MYAKESRLRKKQADSFHELSQIALKDLRKIGKASMVCGPITTGGQGSVEENVRVFGLIITHLKQKGVTVFEQLPYEPALWVLKDQWEKEGNEGYCMPLLTDFYGPVFKSGMIIDSYFLPDWESSFGAKWERNELTQLGIAVHDLETELVNQIASM